MTKDLYTWENGGGTEVDCACIDSTYCPHFPPSGATECVRCHATAEEGNEINGRFTCLSCVSELHGELHQEEVA